MQDLAFFNKLELIFDVLNIILTKKPAFESQNIQHDVSQDHAKSFIVPYLVIKN